jgi:hypothetical protein
MSMKKWNVLPLMKVAAMLLLPVPVAPSVFGADSQAVRVFSSETGKLTSIGQPDFRGKYLKLLRVNRSRPSVSPPSAPYREMGDSEILSRMYQEKYTGPFFKR